MASLNPQALLTLSSQEALAEAAGDQTDGVFHLDLSYVDDDEVVALAKNPLLVQVGALSIRSSGMQPKPLKTLLKSPHFGPLSVLDLHGNYFHDTGTKALAKWEGLAQITHLNVAASGLGGGALKALSESPHTGSLVHLEAFSNNISAAGVRALCASDLAARLEGWALRRNPFGDAGVKAIAASPLMASAARMELSGIGLKAGGIKALLGAGGFEGVRHLDIAGNFDVGDKGIKLLAKSDRVGKLEHLSLMGTGMSDAGALMLAEASGLAELKELIVREREGLSAEGLDALRRSAHVGNAMAAGDRILAERDAAA